MATLARPRTGFHAVHGILGAYPLVCFTGALVTDLAYAGSAVVQWSNFSIWLIAVGCVMGGLAALAGIVDALAHRGRRRRRRPLWHGVATTAMLVLGILNGFVHSRDGWTAVMPTGLILSAVVAALAMVTAWSGYALEQETAR